MKLGAMFSDIFTSFFKKPITEQYPFERKPSPDRLRGKLFWDPNKCTGCMLCVKDCPADAIEILVVDKVAKRFVMKYNMDRCTFCDQCVINCRFDCIGLSKDEWELASLKHEPLTIYYGRDEDVKFILEKAAMPNTGEENC
jgi:NAD(P)H-quinone oxidoreductase subunit I